MASAHRTILTANEQQRLHRESRCEVRFDDLTRALYATDASVYQISPLGVAFPKGPDETAAIIQAAVGMNIPIQPRGAGTGLAGGAVGDGLVIDFSRYNRTISEFDADAGTVRVDAGVVLDQLNTYIKPRGLRFGPDVATSSRATLGGMIANNSSGSHAPRYGTTTDHVRSIDVILVDGRRVTLDADAAGLTDVHREIAELIDRHRNEIESRMPPGLVKRWPGYGLERWLRKRPDLTQLLGGSEGTLAAIVSAELELVPQPKQRGLGAVFFASVTEAMQATVALLDLNPAAIEHVDRLLLDQTAGQLAFKRARSLLELDAKPCESILLVEFFDDVDGPLEELKRRNIGVRRSVFSDPIEMDHIWELRKAGLSLLTGRPGPAKPASGIEDVAVLPSKLPDYVQGLQRLFADLGLEGSFYGHAASGLLHVRPVVDLHTERDVQKYRKAAVEVSALVKQFKGSIAAEHGVGIARTEFLQEHLGSELTAVLARIKELFDPKGLMNPGKIVPDGRYRIETNLRQGPGHEVPLPFEPVLRFAAKDKSFVGNLEQCNGNGACRKLRPSMCPTYRATGDEALSTRGYANTIRAVLERRVDGTDPLRSDELDNALKGCLSCKACSVECPSNVNMALLKAELLHARQKVSGIPLRTRLLSRVDRLGKWGTRMPRLTNGVLRQPMVREVMQTLAGISADRPLPPYAPERFDRWFARRQREGRGDSKGVALLWDDCFVRYHEPHIGRAAVHVLEQAGYRPELPRGRVCCGRPAFSLGQLDLAADFARANIQTLRDLHQDAPIVFLEPSCYSMFAQDYRELGVDGAAALAERSVLFEPFLESALTDDPDALQLVPTPKRLAVHGHCHAKAVKEAEELAAPARRIPDLSVHLLDTGCCGMAGSYGMQRETYELSLQVGELLIEQLRQLPADTEIIASGTSCRHQIEYLYGITPKHMAEVFAEALAARPE